jgi:DNA helicase-2/ATP-dependent DNA helicase PcrA
VVKGLVEDGVSLSEVAVLYRSNAQSRVLEHALFNAAVPYRVYGGMRFFERAEIKHALSYLRLIASPEDDGAFLRVVNFPPRGIGARSIETLQDAARTNGTTLWQAACSGAVSGKSGNAIAGFVRLVEGMRAATDGLTLSEVVAHATSASGLLAHYRNEKDGQDRVDNLEELVSAADSFEREADLEPDAPAQQAVDAASASSATPGNVPRHDESVLAAFLSHAALEAGETQAAQGRAALQLMTVHSAKGLEFHTVFITGLEEGLFPHENSLNEADGIEEERRLMYVAITRARRRLYVTNAQSRMLHGQVRYNIPSRFMAEIPPGLVQWLSPPRTRMSAMDIDTSEWGQRAASQVSMAPRAGSVAPAQAGDASGWRIGQNVRHAKFGQGVIIDAEGRGADARVQVRFRDAGVKWLALEYAKLDAA